MKRRLFLETFLGALGAMNINWGEESVDKIYGTVIYDVIDPEECQDFVWHMTEDKVPSEDVRKVINYIKENNLIDIDKIIKPIHELNLNFIDKSKKEEVIDAIFDIEVRMIDDGKETDRYFIHE
jgi:hypothetical protein